MSTATISDTTTVTTTTEVRQLVDLYFVLPTGVDVREAANAAGIGDATFGQVTGGTLQVIDVAEPARYARQFTDDTDLHTAGGRLVVEHAAEVTELVVAAADLVAAAERAVKVRGRWLTRAYKAARSAKSDPKTAAAIAALRTQHRKARGTKRAELAAAMDALDGAGAVRAAKAAHADAQQALVLARRANAMVIGDIAVAGRRWATARQHKAFYALTDQVADLIGF